MAIKKGFIQVDGLLGPDGTPVLLPPRTDGTITFVSDGGGSALSAGAPLGDLTLPFAGIITGWTLLADQAATVTIDLWKDVLANYPPTVADTITAAAKPALGAVAFNSSTVLTGWTILIAAGDTIRCYLDANDVATRLTLTLVYQKT